jgi:hypothetical protein
MRCNDVINARSGLTPLLYPQPKNNDQGPQRNSPTGLRPVRPWTTTFCNLARAENANCFASRDNEQVLYTIMPPLGGQAWIIHELLSRDHKDGRATWQLVPRYRGIGSEAYMYGRSQGPTPEDAKKDAHIRGRSKLFLNYPG